MEEKALKTTLKQRIGIIIIAVIMLASTIAIYASIIATSNSDGAVSDPQVTAKATELQHKIQDKQDEADALAKELSAQYFEDFKQYRSQVKAYNAATANSESVTTVDLKEGDGKELTDGDGDYLAYYIGYCADESIFDSSFDDYDNPTSLKIPIPGENLIEGWLAGVVGMKVGGVRQITMPGELAYGDSQEICGMTNSPLRFIVYTFPSNEQLTKLRQEINDLAMQYQYLQYNN